MSAAEYKILFDGTAASADELARFESITVEHEAERPSQARLELSVCLDDQGNWSGDARAVHAGAASGSASS